MMASHITHAHLDTESPDQDLDYRQLFLPFESAQKQVDAFRIGIESERFGVNRYNHLPLQYDGEGGILGLFHDFVVRFGWLPESEREGGPTISLHRGQAAITLEPAGQFEFSGSPLGDVHAVESERLSYVDELIAISAEKDLTWIASGFHPLARHDQLPWVPKQRYGIMRVYLASQGGDALEMMRRTATVQANFDFESIEDALRKLRVGLRLSPIVSAMFANGPFVEGRPFGGKSRRIEAWLNVDPSRQGLLPSMWSPESTLDDYVTWALDAPMFMFVRHGQAILNTGQTFRSFFDEGYAGHRATLKDWTTHLNTLFPEVRLKQTIEVRGADSVPSRYVAALPALWTGIFYDPVALDEAERLTQDWSYPAMMALRNNLGHEGLSATFEGQSVAHLAEKIFTIAHDGLVRRSRLDDAGRTEAVHLEALGKLVARGMCPADEVLEKLGEGVPSPEAIVQATSA
jgi:glutamate--cysteine ligase